MSTFAPYHFFGLSVASFLPTPVRSAAVTDQHRGLFQSAPVDVLVACFRLLDLPTIARCARVCRRWWKATEGTVGVRIRFMEKLGQTSTYQRSSNTVIEVTPWRARKKHSVCVQLELETVNHTDWLLLIPTVRTAVLHWTLRAPPTALVSCPLLLSRMRMGGLTRAVRIVQLNAPPVPWGDAPSAAEGLMTLRDYMSLHSGCPQTKALEKAADRVEWARARLMQPGELLSQP